MNLKNKYVVHTLRTLFGILMILSGVMGLLGGPAPEGIPESMVVITQSLWDSGIFHMIKVTETIVGLLFLFNFYPALAALLMAPISVGIFIVNAKLTPAFLPIALIVGAFNLYFGYVYWEQYRALFKRK